MVSIRQCVFLLLGLFLGFNITLFVRQNQCRLIYASHIRPKTLTKELGNRNFLFVGVMTAEQLVQTRAKAVYATWGKNVPGKITFFSSGETGKRLGLPVVSLPDVDDTYPPLKKSLMMIKYMHDFHIDDYEWFMRADDDVYVRNDRLVRFLRSLNSSDDVHLGHAGVGAKEELGMLSLNPGDNYCIGGPGVILSRSVLKKVAPHLEHCLKTAPTTHEDVEVGRCIQLYAGVQCTWAYEMRTLFFHHYTEKGQIFHADLNTKTIRDAITLHPIKEPAYMHRLHLHFMNERIQHLQYEAVKLQRVLRNMDRLIQAEDTALPPQKKVNLQDIRDFHHQLPRNSTEQWNMFTSSSLYFDGMLRSPGTSIRGALKIELTNTLERNSEFLKEEARRTPHSGSMKIQKVNYGYQRFHPLYGIQHIMQLTVKTEKKIRTEKTGKTRQINTSSERWFHTQLPFGNLLHSAEPMTDTSSYVHFLVPLEGRLETFRRFMKNFEEICLKPRLMVKLVVAYSSHVSSPDQHKAILKKYQDKYPFADLIWIDVAGSFSRGIALSLAADQFDRSALLFLCDVDLVFSKAFVDRCRMNTALGRRVYFPIMFSQFDPQISHTNNSLPDSYYSVNKDAGIWRTYSYGPACIYHQDLHAVGGFDTRIKGWGWEDVDLYEKFVNHTEIDVFRAADPNLIHIYHPVNCDPNLPGRQLILCKGSQASGLANQKALVKAMIEMSKDTRHSQHIL
ncbi:chondroitin sulfate synthase 3-like [Montipora capricornis]|uniref:chondroitin sulfate synthase 3-like n=1 Tax=Montipora capricornis TaxID=246305 RepID=UPI0035F1B9C2